MTNTIISSVAKQITNDLQKDMFIGDVRNSATTSGEMRLRKDCNQEEAFARLQS